MLETKDTIPFDDTIQPICIPNLEFGIQVGETCTTGGWGRPGTYYDCLFKFKKPIKSLKAEILDLISEKY